jgi:hypothetical protein
MCSNIPDQQVMPFREEIVFRHNKTPADAGVSVFNIVM